MTDTLLTYNNNTYGFRPLSHRLTIMAAKYKNLKMPYLIFLTLYDRSDSPLADLIQGNFNFSLPQDSANGPAALIEVLNNILGMLS